jgi:hypothetical protein
MLFHHAMSGEPPYSGWYADLFLRCLDASEWDHTILDVHTQPPMIGDVVGRVLTTGTGRSTWAFSWPATPITRCPDRICRTSAFILRKGDRKF